MSDHDIVPGYGGRWMIKMVTLTTYNASGDVESKEDRNIEDTIGV